MSESYYPGAEEGDEARTGKTVRLRKSQFEDIDLFAELWSGMDEAMGIKRARKWTAASVMERLLTVGIAGFWEEIGGKPAGDVDPDELAREVAKHFKRASKD